MTADDQAARAIRRMLDAENREIVALQQVDDQAATIAGQSARVAAVRALRDKYAVENAQLQQHRKDRVDVYGHQDAYALVAHVIADLGAVLDGPAEALEVVRQDDIESTRTTSGPAEALAQAAVAWAEVMRHEEVTPDDHTLTTAVDAYLAASEVAPKHRAGVSVGPAEAPAPMVENTTICGWSDDGRHRWGLGRDKNECADCDAPKWIVGPAEAAEPATTGHRVETWNDSTGYGWRCTCGTGGDGLTDRDECAAIAVRHESEAGAPEPTHDGDSCADMDRWLDDAQGELNEMGLHLQRRHHVHVKRPNGEWHYQAAIDEAIANARAGTVATPDEPGYQRIADAIQQLCEESAEVQIQLRPTKAGVTEWIGDQYLRLAQILDRAGLIDWAAFADEAGSVSTTPDPAAPLTFELYEHVVNLAYDAHREWYPIQKWRRGQAYANVLHTLAPRIQERMEKAGRDVFYRDDLIPAYLDEVRAALDGSTPTENEHG